MTNVKADPIARAGPERIIERDGAGNPLRPMTAGMLGRLFVVPLLIVAAVLTCAVLVTVLFGWIGTGPQEDLSLLIDKLAAGTGEPVASVALLPREKELWLAAMEVARRLQKPDEIPLTEREAVAQRLSGILTKTAAIKPHSDASRKRVGFMAQALGRLGNPAAIDPLTELLRSEEPEIRSAAVRGLAEMAASPEVRRALPGMIRILDDDASPEVRVLAAAALGVLGEATDAGVRDALRRHLSDDDEVRWNSALALLRLGDLSGKADVLEMLDRGYWSARQSKPDPAGRIRPLSDGEISRNIRGALEAFTRTADVELSSAIRKLTEDRNNQVAGAARDALARLAAAGNDGSP